MTTRRLFPFQEDLDIVDAWLLAYDAEWQRCDSVDDVFDISSLPSNSVIDLRVGGATTLHEFPTRETVLA